MPPKHSYHRPTGAKGRKKGQPNPVMQLTPRPKSEDFDPIRQAMEKVLEKSARHEIEETAALEDKMEAMLSQTEKRTLARWQASMDKCDKAVSQALQTVSIDDGLDADLETGITLHEAWMSDPVSAMESLHAYIHEREASEMDATIKEHYLHRSRLANKKAKKVFRSAEQGYEERQAYLEHAMSSETLIKSCKALLHL